MVSKARKFLKKELLYDDEKEEFIQYLHKIILKKKPNLVYLFTYFYVKNDVKVSKLIELRDIINNYSHLIKYLPVNIQDYDNFDVLLSHLNDLIIEDKKEKLIKELPSFLKKEYYNLPAFDSIKIIIKFNLYYLYEKGYIKNFLISSSKYKSILELRDSLITYTKSIQKQENFDVLIKELNNSNNTDLVYTDYKREFIIAYIYNHNSIREFTGNIWCIATKYHFSKYAGNGNKSNRQYIIFFFNKNNKVSFIGVTFYPYNYIKKENQKDDFNILYKTAFDSFNNSVNINKKLKILNIKPHEIDIIFPPRIKDVFQHVKKEGKCTINIFLSLPYHERRKIIDILFRKRDHDGKDLNLSKTIINHLTIKEKKYYLYYK